MKIGGKYNLKGQSERLVYLGKSGHMRHVLSGIVAHVDAALAAAASAED